MGVFIIKIIQSDGNSLRFSNCINYRYSVSKQLRLTAAASYFRFINKQKINNIQLCPTAEKYLNDLDLWNFFNNSDEFLSKYSGMITLTNK